MKLQKIILCIAALLTAFGTGLGLFEVLGFLHAAFEPKKTAEFNFVKPIPKPSVVQFAPFSEGKSDAETPPEVATPPVVSGSDEETCEFNQEGDYSILGDNPQGFEDFDYLNVVMSFYNSKTDKTIPVKPYGWLEMTNRFKFTRLNLTKKRISFVTQSRKGVSYQFDGKFVDEVLKVKDGTGGFYDANVALKGRLTKWRGSLRIAEAKVKFGINCGC